MNDLFKVELTTEPKRIFEGLKKLKLYCYGAKAIPCIGLAEAQFFVYGPGVPPIEEQKIQPRFRLVYDLLDNRIHLDGKRFLSCGNEKCPKHGIRINDRNVHRGDVCGFGKDEKNPGCAGTIDWHVNSIEKSALQVDQRRSSIVLILLDLLKTVKYDKDKDICRFETRFGVVEADIGKVFDYDRSANFKNKFTGDVTVVGKIIREHIINGTLGDLYIGSQNEEEPDKNAN